MKRGKAILAEVGKKYVCAYGAQKRQSEIGGRGKICAKCQKEKLYFTLMFPT